MFNFFGKKKTTEEYCEEGLSYIESKNYQKAISSYNEAIKTDKTNAKAFFGRGKSKTFLGKLDEALQDYNISIKLNPSYVAAYHNRAIIKLFTEETFRGAEEDLRQAIKIEPDYCLAYFSLARLKLLEGYEELAIDLFSKALKLNTDATQELDLYIGRGIAHFLSNNLPSAISDFDQSLSINPKFTTQTYILLNPRFTNAFHLKALAQKRQGEYSLAINTCNEGINLFSQNIVEADSLFFLRASCKVVLKDYAGALSDYDTALTLNPHDILSFEGRGNCKKMLGDQAGATEDYRRYIESYSPRHSSDPNFLHSRAYCKFQVGDLKGSIDDYTELSSFFPANDEYLSERARSKQALEDYLGAIHDYTAASVINPHNIYHLYNRGGCKELLGDQAGAIEDYRKYIELYSREQHSSNEIFLLTLAVCKFHVGDLKGAIEVLDEAIQINPNNAEAHLLMGSYKAASSNIFEAKKCLELAKELYLKNGNTEGYQKALELQGNLKI